MDRFDKLLDEKYSLDRQLNSYMDRAGDTLLQEILAADSPKERGKILDEFDASLEPFAKMYEALGEATARELSCPWWQFW